MTLVMAMLVVLIGVGAFLTVVPAMNNAASSCAYGNRGWGELPAGVNNLAVADTRPMEACDRPDA